MKKNQSLGYWQDQLEKDRAARGDEYQKMNQREALYAGSKKILTQEGTAAKDANNVRNIVFELIESEVDSNIPMPRVTAIRREDTELANVIEDYLRAKVKQLHFKTMNDADERTTYNQGGDFFLVEWDNEKRTHSSVGDLAVRIVHPLQVVAQPGTESVEEADHIILRIGMTRKSVKRRYGVDVEDEPDSYYQNAEDMVTLNMAYYKDEGGKVCRFCWVGDTVVEDISDFQARRLPRCAECGQIMENGVCPQCHSKKSNVEAVDALPLYESIRIASGEEIAPMETVPAMAMAPDGTPLTRDEGEEPAGGPVVIEAEVRTEIPVYRPGMLPVVLRKNVSQYGKLLGSSDVDIIRDQQENVKKLGSKVNEKLLKGGSFVTLPRGVNLETTDKELKVLRLETPQQKSMIDTLNLQPNVSADVSLLEQNYAWAKSALGITDSFQGKSDSTATSGTAKQFAAAQAAGRLESKRQMKNEAYAKLYEMMFKFALAYTDEPVTVPAVDKKGNNVYSVFDRYKFLNRDAAGALYWNDEFIFSVDTTGGLAQNREAMWNQIMQQYSSGSMGDITDITTRILYWKLLEQNQFPMAATVRANLEEQQSAQMQAQQAASAAGMAALPEQSFSAGDMSEALMQQNGGDPYEVSIV